MLGSDVCIASQVESRWVQSLGTVFTDDVPRDRPYPICPARAGRARDHLVSVPTVCCFS